MAVLTIRSLDDEVRDKLRVRAAQHGRSMEAEVRAILTEAVESPVERTTLEVLLNFARQVRESDVVLEGMPRSAPRDPFA